MNTSCPPPNNSSTTGPHNPRWAGITRPYTAEDVVRLRGTVPVEHSLAQLGAEKLWNSLHSEDFVNALGALTGNQAMQQVKAGLKAIYLSGWQVAADANLAGEMYPDQSLYPADSVPQVVKRINNTLLRADQIQHAEGDGRHRLPAADRGRRRSRFRRRAQRLRADEGDDRGRRGRRAFRGPAGLGQEVRPHGRQGAGADPRGDREAGRRAPGRRRDGRADADRRAHRRRGRRPADLRHRSPTTSRSPPASAPSKASTRPATAWTRRSAAAWPTRRTPTWCGARPASRTWSSRASSPRRSTPSSRASCWPTTARRASTGRRTSTTPPSRASRRNSPRYGYKFQFITLAGFHSLNYGMFNLAHGYARRQMSAFVELQEAEFAAADTRLHRGQAPARSRHRLLRRGDPGDPERPVLDRRAEGLDRGRAVRASRATKAVLARRALSGAGSDHGPRCATPLRACTTERRELLAGCYRQPAVMGSVYPPVARPGTWNEAKRPRRRSRWQTPDCRPAAPDAATAALDAGRVRAVRRGRPHAPARCAGETLFRRGDLGTTMYVIAAGRGRSGLRRRPVSKRLGPREFFGELGLLIGDHARSADAIAATDGELIELRHEEFQRLVDRDPAWSRISCAARSCAWCSTSRA